MLADAVIRRPPVPPGAKLLHVTKKFSFWPFGEADCWNAQSAFVTLDANGLTASQITDFVSARVSADNWTQVSAPANVPITVWHKVLDGKYPASLVLSRTTITAGDERPADAYSLELSVEPATNSCDRSTYHQPAG